MISCMLEDKNRDLAYNDIQESINIILDYIKDLTEDVFKQDRKTQDAVIRNLEVIGEAVKDIPKKVRSRYPEIPWISIIGMRNKLIHHYFGVDLDIIWKTIHDDIPRLKLIIEEIIKDRENSTKKE